MNENLRLERCQSYLSTQIKTGARPSATPQKRFRAVTLSREAGSGANVVARHLVELLDEADRKAPRPWTIFDRNLIEKVLEDHQLPARLHKFFPEDRLTELQDIMDEVFGLRPASWTLVQQTTETMLQLAALGNVVLIGRGSSIVTRKLPDVLHVRLVGSLEARVRRLAENRGMTRKSALDFIQQHDLGRRRFVKKYFGEDVANSQLYHLVINTDLVPTEAVAEMLAQIVLKGFGNGADSRH